jgi:hypothetical protein
MPAAQEKKVFEDSKTTTSHLNCHGCGVGLQSDNIGSLGYVSELKIKQYL